MKKILFCSIILFALVFLGSPAYSYAIGISPASRDLCVPPGYVYETYIAPSTNSIEPVNLYISCDLPIIEVANKIEISKGILEVPVKIVVPEGYEEGEYNGVIKICTEKIEDIGEVGALVCVGSSFRINISDGCSKNDHGLKLIKEESEEDFRYYLRVILRKIRKILDIILGLF